MNDSDFLERCLESGNVFSGRLLNVFKDKVLLPGGRESIREYIKHPGAAVVIPYTGKRNILLVRQFRYPVNRTMIELPAGKIDPGEKPEITIIRELEEETCYSTKNVVELTRIHTSVGYSDEVLHLFWASDLKPCVKCHDLDETIEVFQVTIDEAMDMLYSGKITDAKTVIGLFWAEKIINNKGFRQRVLNNKSDLS